MDLFSGHVSSEKTSESSETHQRYKRHHFVIPRYVRDVSDESEEYEFEDLKAKLKCGHTQCTKIRCTVGPLAKGQEAFVALRGRVWVQTLKKVNIILCCWQNSLKIICSMLLLVRKFGNKFRSDASAILRISPNYF